jgi:branched-chain amino acid transport system permease protein
MEISQLLVQILNGVSYGLLLFLLASGLSLIFGLMGIVNLAHGSYYMLGAYLGLMILRSTGSFILAVIGASTIMAFIGFMMERIFFSKLYKRELDQVLLTFGFAYIFMDIARWIWGGTPYSLPKPQLFDISISILGEIFPVYRIMMITVGLAVALSLWLLIEKTRTGSIIRAGVDDKEMVNAMGINIYMYFSAIFALGAFLAAFGGVIGGPILGVYPGLDFEILVITLAVVVVGGLGTLRGAFWGSILIGFVDTFGKTFFPNYAIATIYIAMALILIIKPTGLLGREDS